MKCNHCGKEIVDDSVFCEYCGKKVGDAPRRSLLIIIIVTAALLAMAIIVGLLRQSSVPKAGTVLSYTERVTSKEGYGDVTSYFVFRESNEVIWLMGTSRQNMFPVGFGAYNPSTSEMSFSATDTLHQGISIYYGVEDAIVFNIDLAKKTAMLNTNDKWLKPFYNDGNVFTLNKEDYALEPSKALVGSHWRGRFVDYSIVFKSLNEVMIIEDNGEVESRAYVCFDDMVSIKVGDNLEYENLIGKYQGGDEMTLCIRGLDTGNYSDKCVTLHRITAESDTEAFQSCQTVDDYREYMRSYGRNALYYTAAKNYVDEYVSDSIAYAGCTTIKACDAYLETYPKGRYVDEVKAKKAELEAKAKQVIRDAAEGYGWVDLGLPSGTLWATCNLGASMPEDYGNYYALGETETKKVYNWDTYKYAIGEYKMTKYLLDGYFDRDKPSILEKADDPASSNWGGGWCTPSKMQLEELLQYTINQWTTRNGVAGRLFTSKKNGKSIFFPAAGNHLESELNHCGSIGFYWSTEFGGYLASAWYLYFDSEGCSVRNYYCDLGFSVRPVREK